MMMNSTTRNIEIYEATIETLSRNFTMDVVLSNVEPKTLLTLENLHYLSLIEKYQHLNGIVMEDKHQEPEMSIHIVLGIGNIRKSRPTQWSELAKQGEPVVEKTHLRWTSTSPGKDFHVTSMMLTRNSICDHDKLCRLDVLGIEDSPTGGQMYIYQSFKIRWNVKPIDLMETQTPITSQQQKWKPIKTK